MVDLFEKIEEGVEFAEAASTLIPGVKVVNIAYLLILRTRETKKPVISGKIYRLVKRTGKPSRITLRKHTGATRSAKKQQPLPIYMVLQKTMRMK